MWKNVKHDRVGRQAPATKEDFTAAIRAALRRLQRLPHVVRGFFADPDLRYITV